MTSYYVDIGIRPDPEFPTHQLLSAAFAKLHRELAVRSASTISVSFPGYAISPITLGSTMRMIGPLHELGALMDASWLASLRDHVVVTPIVAVPADAEQRMLRRVQAKSSAERIQRRQIRRHGLSEEEAKAKYDGVRPQRLRLPFIMLASGSSGQSFKLFLKLGGIEANTQSGTFNAYGLSQTATIPWF